MLSRFIEYRNVTDRQTDKIAISISRVSMPTGDKYFRLRLNVAVDDRMSFSSVGGRFHAQGAATENARSPIRRSVLGWKRSPSVLG